MSIQKKLVIKKDGTHPPHNVCESCVEVGKVKYIDEMVSAMVVQADIIKRAREEGVEVSEIMPRIKEAYEKNVAQAT